MLADPAQMGDGGPAQQAAAGRGEAGKDDSRIHLVAPALDETVADEPVEATGQRARRHEDSHGEVRHAKAAGRVRKPQQDVVIAERDSVFASQLRIESAVDLVMGMEERLPGAELGITQASRHGLERTPSYLQLQISARTIRT